MWEGSIDSLIVGRRLSFYRRRHPLNVIPGRVPMIFIRMQDEFIAGIRKKINAKSLSILSRNTPDESL